MVSKQSEEFLKNLRLYLFSSGKNEKEIEDIISELEDHLLEAESQGKSVEDIIGQSPKHYMEQIAQEMSFDALGWMKYLPVIMIGSLSYIVLGDALRDELQYTLLELVGYPLILVLFIMLISLSFKYLAATPPDYKHWIVFGFLGVFPMGMFLGLLILNRRMETEMVVFGTAGQIAAIVATILIFIAISIWTKTWISIILPVILFVPEFIINSTSFDEGTKLTMSAVITPVLFAFFFWYLLKKEKTETCEDC
ncbi:hypothetical protein D3H55_14040 [Bacillus salacetis]|uniref:HAAS transmembrane region domain-containing protein n=1 Tax=Bacillus salacetis TaxID=2315464 RepID=A0A3A1QYP4_9BACI|nr:hypothetical protein [Bacillus salacetis]RIW31998.1 hypothetical protein D3H55_14040 [Bacillus salacetis]